MHPENYLLVIGIDKYNDSRYKALSNSKVDVLRLSKTLEEKYGFIPVIAPIFDSEATRENIVTALNELASSISKEDNLIVYFAGHGNQNSFSKKGYWVPIDVTKKTSNLIYNSEVIDLIEGIQAKHILLISDSCYSGTFITRTRSGVSDLSLEDLENRKSRWVLVSGGEETVDDGIAGQGSPFSRAVCQFLEDNETPEVPASFLFAFVINSLQNKTWQKPDAALIRCEGNEGGQMIFRIKSVKIILRSEEQKRDFPLPKYPHIEYYISRTVNDYDQKQDQSWFFRQGRGKMYLEDILKGEKKLVILGSAGSGKSVELYQLALKMKNPSSQFIPVYKRFNTYVDEDLENYIPNGWEDVNQDRIIIFLDGLDEVLPHHFTTAIRKITVFAEKYPRVRILISCRTNFYELPYEDFNGTLDGFNVYKLNDLSFLEIKEYVSNHFGLDGDRFLKDTIDSSLEDLVQKPFFLNILIKHFKEKGKFEATRAGIMEEALLSQFSNNHEHFKSTIQPPLGRQEIFSLLEKIAFVMEMMGKNLIPDNELKQVFHDAKIYERIKYLPAFTHNTENENWQFDHNNIQEYLSSRILARQSFEKILKDITLHGTNRVKPNWANTLSFFISIANEPVKQQILDWLLYNDREFILKFEPDRIPTQMRIQLVKEIFRFYTDQDIWILSNKFSNKDLARVGAFPDILDFLLSVINDFESTRMAKMNAIHILDDFNLNNFTKYKLPAKEALLKVLVNESTDNYFAYSALSALASLGIADEKAIDFVVNLFRKRKNEYIRAGLYKLILESGFTDNYLEILIEGLDLTEIDDPIEDRNDINLMDESLYLQEAFKKVVTADGLKKLLQYFDDPRERRLFLLNDFKDVFSEIIQNTVKAWVTDKSVYESVFGLYKTIGKSYDSEMTKLILPFFNQTNTAWFTFKNIWKDPTIEQEIKLFLSLRLLNIIILPELLISYKNGEISDDEIKTIYHQLLWQETRIADSTQLLAMLEREAKGISGVILERPVFPNWSQINQERAQKSFNMLFSWESIFSEIESIAKKLGTDTFTQENLYDLFRENRQMIDAHFTDTSIDVVRYLVYGGLTINVRFIFGWLKNDTSNDYQIQHIYQYLTGSYGSSIKVNLTQREFIITWCKTFSSYNDIEKMIFTGDRRIMILWYFVRQYQPDLPENKLLDFTMYFAFNSQARLSDSGTIEELELLVSKTEIQKRVLENLKKRNSNTLSWLNNAAYSIRKNMKEAEEDIFAGLAETDDWEYKFNELLELWFSRYKETWQLKGLISKVRALYLKQTAIVLLLRSNKENSYVADILRSIVEEATESDQNRVWAANQLMFMGDLKGLELITDFLLDEKKSALDYHTQIAYISSFTNTQALPYLLKLYRLSKQPKFTNDKFSFFESKIVEAIYNIGVQSQANLLVIKSQLEDFIKKYSTELGNLNFFHLTLLRMEDQLLMKQAKGLSLFEALSDYDGRTQIT